MRHGGAANRSGTMFIGDTKFPGKAVRLIPFIFNADQTYVLEFGDLYMRVHRNGAGPLRETAKTITNVTQGNPGIVGITSSGFSAGDHVYISGVVGMTELNGHTFVLANQVGGTFELRDIFGNNVDTSAYGAYVSGGTAERVYQVTTPFLEADLSDLKLVQSADVVTIVHPSYAPRELSRTGHLLWSLATKAFGPTAFQVNLSQSGLSAGTAVEYAVTYVSPTGEESNLCVSSGTTVATVGVSTEPTTAAPCTIQCNPGGISSKLPGSFFKVFKRVAGNGGMWGYIGSIEYNYITLKDDGIDPDYLQQPPAVRTPFASAGNYPAAVSYCQQRLIFAATNNAPETVWSSKSGFPGNFTISSPLQDDDAVTFSLRGRQVNRVEHLLELSQLVVLTSGGEWVIGGDSAGILRPGEVNPKQHGYSGAAKLPPLVIGGSAIFLQARGSVIRDLGFDIQVEGYRGNDLTIFSAHLFDGHSVVDWAYQQTPHSIVWAVRDDGVLLGLTYIREHELVAWHRHDFAGGLVENVCVVPEDGEDAVYLVVKRTIDGQARRYIERMHSRIVEDVVDTVFMDSALTYDGRNDDESHTMTLSGGTEWDYTEMLSLTSSEAFFTVDDVGNAVHLIAADGSVIRFTIKGYTSSTVVTGKANRDVPLDLRGAAVSDWAKAVDEVSGLWHLEGEEVAILADGLVIASPNNDRYPVKSVADGKVSLGRPYAVVHVGLPITADLETLDIDVPQGNSLAGKAKSISDVGLHVESTRGVFVGPKPPEDDEEDPLEGLIEMKCRDNEPIGDPVALKTGVVEVGIRSEWNVNGRIFVRQVDPLPVSVLAIIPTGFVPYGG